MIAAAVFEEISIIDRINRPGKADFGDNMDDIRTDFEGLLAGSEKHLRPYINVLGGAQNKYKPQLSQPRGVRPDRQAP